MTGELLDSSRRFALATLYSDYLKKRNTTREAFDRPPVVGDHAPKTNLLVLEVGQKFGHAFCVLGTYKVRLFVHSFSTVIEANTTSIKAKPFCFRHGMPFGGSDRCSGGRPQGHHLADVGSLAACIPSVPHPQCILCIHWAFRIQHREHYWSMVGGGDAVGLPIDWCPLRDDYFLESLELHRILRVLASVPITCFE